MLTGVPLAAQEVLENLRDRWHQADNPPPDLLLTEDEFLSFLHPEHSRGMLRFMVKEIVRDLGEAGPCQAPRGACSLSRGRSGGQALGWGGLGLGSEGEQPGGRHVASARSPVPVRHGCSALVGNVTNGKFGSRTPWLTLLVALRLPGPLEAERPHCSQTRTVTSSSHCLSSSPCPWGPWRTSAARTWTTAG